MTDLVLKEREQQTLAAIYAAEPVPGRPLPPPDVLTTISRLVPCDAIGAVLADEHGCVVEEVMLPRGYYDPWVDDGPDEPPGLGSAPLYVGVVHWGRDPAKAEACAALPGTTRDGLAVGFRNGTGVAQLWLDRTSLFTDRELALVRLLMPALQRILRERPTPRLPVSLTVQERRVLMCVASGMSNQQIAEFLFVAPSTVRKHLEHCYRKLGVTNRLAAVAALQGRDLTDMDLLDRLQRLG